MNSVRFTLFREDSLCLEISHRFLGKLFKTISKTRKPAIWTVWFSYDEEEKIFKSGYKYKEFVKNLDKQTSKVIYELVRDIIESELIKS